MIRLSEKSRRVFRAIYRGLGVTAISLVFQACYGPVQDFYAMYGMPPDIHYEELVIRGCIRSQKTDEPVRGISIWIEGVTTDYVCLTDANGEFYIYAPMQDSYTIVFTDIDGDKNGQFKPYTINLTKEEAKALFESPLTIALEEVDEE